MEHALRRFVKRFYVATTIVEYCIIIPIALIAIALTTDIPTGQLYSIFIIIGIVAAIALIAFAPVQKYMFKPIIQMADCLKEGNDITPAIKILVRERLFALPVIRSFVGILFWFFSIGLVITGMWIVNVDVDTILICFVVGACILAAVRVTLFIIPQKLIDDFIQKNDFVNELINYSNKKHASFWGSLKNVLTISISSMILLTILLIVSFSLLYIYKARIYEYSQQMITNGKAVTQDIVETLNDRLQPAVVAARSDNIDMLRSIAQNDDVVDAFMVRNTINAVVQKSVKGVLNGISALSLGMADGIKMKKSFIGDCVYIPGIQKSIVVCAGWSNKEMYCIAYDMHKLFLKKYSHFTIGKRGYMVLMDSTGLTLSHPNIQYIGKVNLSHYDWGKQAFLKSDVVKYLWEGEHKRIAVVRHQNPSFAVAQTVYDKELGMTVQDAMQFILILAIVIIVLGILASNLILSFAFAPFPIVRDSIYEIAEGNITATPVIVYGNELGIIATSLKVLSNKIGSVIGQIKSASEELSIASGEMSSGISTLSDSASSQSASTQEITATIEEISANLDSIVANTKDESKSLENFSKHLEELSKSIFSFLLIMEESSQRTESISNEAQQGQVALQQMNASMRKIVESSRGISNIAQIIRGIADQVNLLALNAAIEAARAGDAGKGFAVVADEITKLADQIAQSLKDIDNLMRINEKEISQGIAITESTVTTISNIIQGIESIHNDVKTMGQKIQEQSMIFTEIKKIWDVTESLSRHILESVEDQKNAVDEIVRSINTINSLTQNVAGISEQMNSSAENLASMAENLKALLEYFKM
ncbi:MAG: methyl-accepting chemotaxis protein [Spirochaetota bacterium]